MAHKIFFRDIIMLRSVGKLTLYNYCSYYYKVQKATSRYIPLFLDPLKKLSITVLFFIQFLVKIMFYHCVRFIRNTRYSLLIFHKRFCCRVLVLQRTCCVFMNKAGLHVVFDFGRCAFIFFKKRRNTPCFSCGDISRIDFSNQ